MFMVNQYRNLIVQKSHGSCEKKNDVHPLIFQSYLLRRCFRYAFGLGSKKIHCFQAVWKLEPFSIELLKVCGVADWTIHSIRYGKLQIWKAYRWLVGLLVVGISVGSPIDIQTRWVRYEWTRPSNTSWGQRLLGLPFTANQVWLMTGGWLGCLGKNPS